MDSGFNHENGLAVLSTEGPNDALDGFHSLPRHRLHFSGALAGCAGLLFLSVCGARGQRERHKYSVTSSVRAEGISRELERCYR